ncbi:MAG: hypothetical protein M0C28_11935 [Candidatus Moduliflexus flocculans]|nr:hypothetical protein [Candidatus Moduliflexus flocculans]
MLDLRGWDFTRDGPVELAGEFEFYWGRHLDPGQIERAARGAAYVALPGYWNGQRVDGETLPGEGFASYRLTVLVAPSRIPLALQVREVSTAYRLFVDGELLAAAGRSERLLRPASPNTCPRWRVSGSPPAASTSFCRSPTSTTAAAAPGTSSRSAPSATSSSCTSASAGSISSCSAASSSWRSITWGSSWPAGSSGRRSTSASSASWSP